MLLHVRFVHRKLATSWRVHCAHNAIAADDVRQVVDAGHRLPHGISQFSWINKNYRITVKLSARLVHKFPMWIIGSLTLTLRRIFAPFLFPICFTVGSIFSSSTVGWRSHCSTMRDRCFVVIKTASDSSAFGDRLCARRRSCRSYWVV